jgi:predicted nucleic acid-binding protein
VKFLDANVFLRVLTNDDPVKAAASLALLERLDSGADEAATCEAVIAEVVYVLTSHVSYRLTHEQVRNRFKPLLELRGLRIEHKTSCLRALDLYASAPTLDIEDAMIIAHMEREGWTELVSYDRDFDRVSGPVRIEP